MKVLHCDEPPFAGKEASIFLAGPTPRRADVPSWRPDAVELLRELNFAGVVLIPERRDRSVKFSYDDQVEWERVGLTLATGIVFWVPRNMETMLALTTNVEFGYWLAKSPQRILYGRPPGAPHTRYLDWLLQFERKDANPFDDLRTLLQAAVAFTQERS